ncbi:MAG: hypothetical protein QG648_355 [Patescibacteria group bacterium]|nr:hypothetical protein [Patescibacteria group bacterium]
MANAPNVGRKYQEDGNYKFLILITQYQDTNHTNYTNYSNYSNYPNQYLISNV